LLLPLLGCLPPAGEATQVTTAAQARAAAKTGAMRRIDRLLSQEALLEEGEAGGVQHGGAESDDDGYEQVAEAALREGGPPAGTEEAAISDGTLRRIVASRVREAKAQHKVMKQFMSSFARNLKLSVLEDSKGDMPEEERLADIAKLKRGEDFSPPPPKKRNQNPVPDASQQVLSGRAVGLQSQAAAPKSTDTKMVGGHHQHHHRHHRRHARHAKPGPVRMLNGGGGGAPHQEHSVEAAIPAAGEEEFAPPPPQPHSQKLLAPPRSAALLPRSVLLNEGPAPLPGGGDGGSDPAAAALLAEQREEDLEAGGGWRSRRSPRRHRMTMRERREAAAEAEAAGCGPLGVPCPPSGGPPDDEQAEELAGERQPLSLGAMDERYDFQKPVRGTRMPKSGAERHCIWGAAFALLVCMVAPVAA